MATSLRRTMLIGRTRSYCPRRGPRSLGLSAHSPTHGGPTRSASWPAPPGRALRTLTQLRSQGSWS
eukprot:9632967-Alexandrium_andersonii.AAC.1